METKAKRKHPSATAYVDGLYSLPDVPVEHSQRIEKVLLRDVDDWAAKAHAALLRTDANSDPLDPRLGLAWCRFIYALIVRSPEYLELARQQLANLNPETLESVRDEYPRLRSSEDPESFDEFKDKYQRSSIPIAGAHALPHLIYSRRVAREIASFIWSTRGVFRAKRTMLTSDRPIIMTNGLSRSDAHIVIPISPTMLFHASRIQKTCDWINSLNSDLVVETVNGKVAGQAIKYVYGIDDNQLRFVANRLGKKARATPLEPAK